jgi:HSP20 family molecular chaperone IbpA
MNRWRPQHLDWSDFRNDLFEQIPFTGKEWNPKGIENFVHDTLRNYMPKSLFKQAGISSFQSSAVDYNVFETHRSVFVRCRLPAEASPRSFRFYVNRRKLRIESGDSTEDIPLPADVSANRTIARYENGVVEIRLPKVGDAEPFQEIFIRDGGK